MSLKEDVTTARKRWQAAVNDLRDSRAELEKVRKKIKAAKPGSDKRADLRKEQDQLAKEKKALAEMVKRRDAVKTDLVKQLKKRQAASSQKPSGNWTAPGPDTWGGSRAVIDNEVLPVYQRHGIPVTSRKRPASDPLSRANPASDHNMANTTADALDGGAVNAYSVADEVGAAVGVGGVDDYVIESFSYNGVSFRIQVIAGTHGTGPHLHTGVRRT